MSYCRWSSDDFRSDVYVYESAGGVDVHVARSRLPAEFFDTLPEPIPYSLENFAAWYERGREVGALVDAASGDAEPIDLPHAGTSCTFADHAEAADALEWLAALGYHVPDGVIDDLRADQAAP